MARRTGLLLAGVAIFLNLGTAVAQESVRVLAEVPGPPEGMIVHPSGQLYVGMALTGEILKIDPVAGKREVYAVLPSKPKATFLAGLAFGPAGEIYACVISFDPSIWSGVYKVPAGGGNGVRFAGPMPFPNGLALDTKGNVYVSSSTDGRVHRADPAGALTLVSDAEVLKSHHPHGQFAIGVNGLAFDRAGNLYMSNTDDGKILKMGILADGRAGPITEVATGLAGADGIEFDARGNLYVALNRQDRVVLLTPEGQIRDVASGPLTKFPSTVVPAGDKVYIANFNFATRVPPFTITVVGAPVHR